MSTTQTCFKLNVSIVYVVILHNNNPLLNIILQLPCLHLNNNIVLI